MASDDDDGCDHGGSENSTVDLEVSNGHNKATKHLPENSFWHGRST